MVNVQDVVLVHIDNKPAFFARIEGIAADMKPGWWQVTFLVLQLPLQVRTWILDSSQVAGEPFTMGGTPVRLERVEPYRATPSDGEGPPPDGEPTPPGRKVVSLAERRKS
jgi:hypothetical protein